MTVAEGVLQSVDNMMHTNEGPIQDELVVLDALVTEEIDQGQDVDTSLDSWLGKFALAPHAPPPPSPRTMAVGQN